MKTPVHPSQSLSLEQILRDVDLEKINNGAEKKKRVFNLNLDSIEFSTPPPTSDGETKTARMQ